MASDGALKQDRRGGRRLELPSTEAVLLDTMESLLDTLGVTYSRSGGGITVAGKEFDRVRWTDYRMYNTMLAVGLSPRKSNILPALSLPVDDRGLNYFWLVVRGVFDGDGSVIVDRAGTVKCARIISGAPLFLRWLKRELHLRGVYNTSIIPAAKDKAAEILVIGAEHVPLLQRRMIADWDGYENFAELGHPEKKERLLRRQVNIVHRPGVAKRRLTRPKIAAAVRYCELVLGRMPNCTEYERVRALVVDRLADKRAFPGYGVPIKHFGSWPRALAYVAGQGEQGPLAVPGPLPAAADVLRQRGPAPENRQAFADRIAAIKRAKTLSKAEAAMAYCRDVLGRWPNSGEYKRIRVAVVGRLEGPDAFPTQGCLQRFHFARWADLLLHMDALEDLVPLAVPGLPPPLEQVVLPRGPPPRLQAGRPSRADDRAGLLLIGREAGHALALMLDRLQEHLKRPHPELTDAERAVDDQLLLGLRVAGDVEDLVEAALEVAVGAESHRTTLGRAR